MQNIRTGEYSVQKNNRSDHVPHSFSLEKDRTILCAEGIKDVESFDDKTVFAMPEGLRMTVKGKDLKVTAFSAESGKLCIEGEIDSVTYAPALSRKAGFFAKIFR